MREHFHNLQALRGVACLLVVGFHLWGAEASFGVETPIFREVRRFGFAGVDLFFVLSGFLITATNRRHLGRPAAVPGYLFRRFWRLYPAYWAAVGLSAVFGGITFGWPVFSPEWVADWPAWLALAPTPVTNPVLGQAWTLVFEVAFYLALGAVMPFPPRWAAAAFGAWAVAVLAGQARPEPGPATGKLLLSPYVLEFLGGCVVAWLTGRGGRAGWRAALGVGLMYALAGVVAAGAGLAGPDGSAMTSPRLRVLVFGPPAVLVVYGLVAAEGRWPRRLPGWLLRVGDASYSLYLLHVPVLLAAVVVGLRFRHTRLAHTGWLVGTLAAVLAVGLVFHARVERPLLNLGRRRRKNPPRAEPAAPEPLSRAA